MSEKTKDVLLRAGKTFIQAFFGVLITEVVALIKVGFPETWDLIWAYFAPVIAGALAAGISAGWNALFLKSGEGE